MADASLTALYQDIILDHYRRPRNKGTLEHASVSIPMRNPFCGDEVTLELRMTGDEISDVRFTGHGCSISQASTSMMTELVKGKHASEVEHISERFRAMVMGDAEAARDSGIGKARALAGVARFPARVKCALLGWNALERGLAESESQHAAEATVATVDTEIQSGV
jgi:nitrogen fixation protein NifU and related proteins